MKQDNNYFAKGAIFVLISALLVKVIGVIYKIPLSYILSDEGMGYFNSAYTVFSFFYIVAGAGVPKAISILVSSADGNLDTKKNRRIYRAAIKFFSLCGIMCTLIFLLLSKPLSLFLKSYGSFASMFAIAPSVFFVCASSVIRGYFTGKMKFIPCAVSELIASLGKLVFGLLFAFVAVSITKDMVIISSATIFGTTIGALTSWLYLFIRTKSEAEIYRLREKQALLSPELKEILSISLPLTVSAFISSISSVFDLAIFMRTLNRDGYTAYQASVLYGNYSTLVIPMLNSVSSVISPILLLILPLIGRDRELKSNKGTVNFIIKGAFICASLLSVVLLFESEKVLSFLFEDTGAVLAAPSLSYMACGIFLMCILLVINTVLEGAGQVKIPLISLLAATVIKSVLSVFLLRNDSYGIAGAAVSITLSYGAGLIISSVALLRKKSFSTLSIFKSAFFSLALALISYFLTNGLFAALRVDFFLLKLLIFSLIYAIFDYILLFDRSEKSKIWAKLIKKSPQLIQKDEE